MSPASVWMWRPLFIVGAIVYFNGGSQHPRGAMVDMLRDPAWFRAHATSLTGLLLLAAGLFIYRKTTGASGRTARWTLFAFIATLLEAVEMGVHTLASVDGPAMAAGHSTPVFTTHFWLAFTIYPLFAIAMIGLILTGQRERSLGSPWIGWIGILGALAHGLVMALLLSGVAVAPILFPISVLSLSIWFLLAGLLPARRRAASTPLGSGAQVPTPAS